MLTVSVPQPHDFEGKTCKVGVCFISTPTPLGGGYERILCVRLISQPLNPTKNCLPFPALLFFLEKVIYYTHFSYLTDIYI